MINDKSLIIKYCPKRRDEIFRLFSMSNIWVIFDLASVAWQQESTCHGFHFKHGSDIKFTTV